MIRIIKSFRTITSILFIAILLITYSYMIESLMVFTNVEKTRMIKVESLFYIGLAVFVFVNLIFFLFDKALISYRSRNDVSPFFTSSTFLGWLYFLNLSVNILLITIIMYLGFINSKDYYQFMSYSILLYLGPVLIIVSLIALPVLYFRYR